MDTKELREKMEIIFNRENDRLQYAHSEYNYRYLGRGPLTEEMSTGLLSEDPTLYELDFPTLDSLKKLYISIENNEKLKIYFVNELIKHTIESIPLHGVQIIDKSVLSFATLLELGFTLEAVNTLLKKASKYNISRPLNFLFGFIYHEYPKLTTEDLKILSTLNELTLSYTSYHRVVIRQINKIRYDNLVNELEGINFQINQDRRKVIEKMKYFGFDESLTKFLNKAESYYWDTSKDEFDWKMVTSTLREFSQEFVESVAKRIKLKTREAYPSEEKTPTGNMRVYIKKHLNLEEVDKLYDVLIEIINSEGSHAFITDREYFRLTKNMLIEIALIVLTKLEKFEES